MHPVISYPVTFSASADQTECASDELHPMNTPVGLPRTVSGFTPDFKKPVYNEVDSFLPAYLFYTSCRNYRNKLPVYNSYTEIITDGIIMNLVLEN